METDDIARAAETPGGKVRDGWQAEPVGCLDRGPVDAHLLGDGAVGGGAAYRPECQVEDPAQDVAGHQRQEDGDAPEETAQPHAERDHDEHDDERQPRILRPVGVRDYRGQVEADQHHDRAGHHGWQGFVDHPGAREVDDQTHHEQGQPDHEERTREGRRVAACRVDRGRHTHEGGRRSEIAGHAVFHDEQEDQRRDAAHHHRELRIEPHQQRENERGAEHRDDVLGAEPDRASPTEPFSRGYHRPGNEDSVVVQLPAEHGPVLSSRACYCPCRSGEQMTPPFMKTRRVFSEAG